MFYPEEMTAEEIEEFDYEFNRRIDIDRGEGQFWAENAECQVVADLQREEFLAEQEPAFFGA